jgi:hypothetical protein
MALPGGHALPGCRRLLSGRDNASDRFRPGRIVLAAGAREPM